MKKLNITLMALALALALTACGTQVDQPIVSSQENTEQSTSAPSSAAKETRIIYGKVTSIVGNEIEVSLAEFPETNQDESTQTDDAPDENLDSLDSMPAMMTTPAMSAGEAVDAGSNLEYTGETMSLTISAGAKITKDGQETTLSSLKKGNVFSAIIDDVDTLHVSVVDILE